MRSGVGAKVDPRLPFPPPVPEGFRLEGGYVVRNEEPDKETHE